MLHVFAVVIKISVCISPLFLAFILYIGEEKINVQHASKKISRQHKEVLFYFFSESRLCYFMQIVSLRVVPLRVLIDEC